MLGGAGSSNETSSLLDGKEVVGKYDGAAPGSDKGKLRMAAERIVSEKKGRPSTMKAAASVLLSRLRTSKQKNKEKDREWQETHVDVFHSSTRMSIVGDASFRRRSSVGGVAANDSSMSLESDGEGAKEEGARRVVTRDVFWRMVETPIIVILIGVLTALVSVGVNVATKRIYPIRKQIVFGIPDEKMVVKFGIYCAFSLTAALLSNLMTQKICPEASGGGIPEVKTLLDGSYKKALVMPRTVFTKAVGLVLAITAGLSVGKEGPFVHIAVAIADTLMRQKCFSHLAKNDAKRLEILACAAAAGVGATFGTPFAAVLFSIEVTAGYFMVRNLPRCFLCAISGTLSMTFLGFDRVFGLFSDLPKMAKGYHARDLVCFVGLGALCGVLGCVFVYFVKRVVEFRNDFLQGGWRGLGVGWGVGGRRWFYVFSVTLLVSPFVFFDMSAGVASFGDQHSIVNYMFQTAPLGLSVPLVLYLPFKFFVTIACVTLPLPVGLFTPVFLIGGTTGRIVGEVLRLMDAHVLQKRGVEGFITLQPWEFALIGAAAFSSGVTRAISTALIILELSGEHHLRVPCGIAVLVAYFIGNRFTKNVYDTLVDTNGNPMLQALPDSLCFCTAVDVMGDYGEEGGGRGGMDGLPPIVSLDMSARQTINMFERCVLSDNMILPVVDSLESRLLVGAVCVRDLRFAVGNITRTVSMLDEGGDGERGVYFIKKSGEVVGRMEMGAEERSVVGGEVAGEGNGSLLDESLNFVVTTNGRRSSVVKEGQVSPRRRIPKRFKINMDPAPYQLVHSTELTKIHLVFRMLKLNTSYITKGGKLVGVVDRARLREFIGDREKLPTDKLYVLVGGVWGCIKNFLGVEEVGSEDTDEEEDTEGGGAEMVL